MATFDSLLDLVYPKGSVYLCTSATNPGTLFGGTWGQHKGAVLASAGANSFATVNNNGGNLKITVAQLPSHNHLSLLKNDWIGYWGTASGGIVALSNGSNGQWGCCGESGTTGSKMITATGGGAGLLALSLLCQLLGAHCLTSYIKVVMNNG